MYPNPLLTCALALRSTGEGTLGGVTPVPQLGNTAP